MSVLVAPLIRDVRTLLHDNDRVRWSDETLLSWGNDAVVAIVTRFDDAAMRVIDFQLEPGARQQMPSDCFRILKIHRNVDGKVILRCDRASLDAFMPDWVRVPRSGRSAQVTHYMEDVRKDVFYVFPAQGTQPGKVQVEYVYLPAPVSGLSGQFDVRVEYRPRIIDYIMFRAFSEDSEVGAAERAVAYFQAFNS